VCNIRKNHKIINSPVDHYTVGMMLIVPTEKELMRKSRNSGGEKKPAFSVMMSHVLCKIVVFCISFLGAYMLGQDCYIQALEKHQPTTHYNRNTKLNTLWTNLTEFT
jgi:hypothetical protein